MKFYSMIFLRVTVLLWKTNIVILFNGIRFLGTSFNLGRGFLLRNPWETEVFFFFFCNNDIVLQSSSLVYSKRYVIGYVLNGSIFHSYISV